MSIKNVSKAVNVSFYAAYFIAYEYFAIFVCIFMCIFWLVGLHILPSSRTNVCTRGSRAQPHLVPPQVDRGVLRADRGGEVAAAAVGQVEAVPRGPALRPHRLPHRNGHLPRNRCNYIVGMSPLSYLALATCK